MCALKKTAALFVCAAMLFMCFPNAVMAAGRTYYVDSENGNDNNNGLTTVGAWKNISKLNSVTFSAGDRIYLKAGSVWSGQYLRPSGSGTAQQPIVIDMYGSGEKPIINADGAASAAISLMYIQGWEVHNLELTNNPKTAMKYCRGLYAETGNSDRREYFRFSDLYIHDVNGVLTDHMNGGIIMRGYSTNGAKAEFRDVTIENCVIENVNRNGIRVVGQSSRGSSGIAIRNNVLNKIGGDGIVTVGTNGAVIEHNIASECFYRYSEMKNVACVAIWTYGSDNTLIQYNEAYATKSTADGEGFDSDYNCTNSVFQYNYSHDNDGGFMLICNNPASESNFNTGTIVRYNMSVNDKNSGVMLSGNPTDAKIYNNTIYIGEGIKTNPVNTYAWNGGHAENISFYNNIFCNLGTGDFNMGATENYVFDNNLFYGGNASAYPEDDNKITENPLFVSPGKAERGIESLDGYKLCKDSACIDRGKVIENSGGKDYFGNEISDGKPDVGAAEYIGEKPAPIPNEPMYTEKYGTAGSFALSYLSNSKNIVTIPAASEVTVCGSIDERTLNGKEYSDFTAITAVYSGGVLYDVKLQKISGDFEYTVNTPENTTDCVIKTIVWDSLTTMRPVVKGYAFSEGDKL